MDIIKMARELGKAIQEDDRYLALRLTYGEWNKIYKENDEIK